VPIILGNDGECQAHELWARVTCIFTSDPNLSAEVSGKVRLPRHLNLVSAPCVYVPKIET